MNLFINLSEPTKNRESGVHVLEKGHHCKAICRKFAEFGTSNCDMRQNAPHNTPAIHTKDRNYLTTDILSLAANVKDSHSGYP